MSTTSDMSSRSCIERSRATSAGSSVIGVSRRSVAHSARENTRYGETSCSVRCSIVVLSLCLAALARRLFVEAGLQRARAELGLDLRERDAAGMEHDQEMVEHVGGLADHPLAVLADRGNRCLDRFLAEFFGAMRHATVQEPARIGHVGTRLRARLDALFEVVEGECLSHGAFLSPLAKIFSSHCSKNDARETGWQMSPGVPIFLHQRRGAF